MSYLSDFTLLDMAGLVGVCLYVLPYALLQVAPRGYGLGWFTALNLGAAILVALSLVEDFNLAAALVQALWILISLAALVRMGCRRRPSRT